jgi:PTS system fructose-specific IIC component/PTS system nitrogen regulatory IIA component
MKLSERFVENGIIINSTQKDKSEIIREMVSLMASVNDLKNQDDILEAVLSREEKMSTGIGCGLAVPHAKAPQVDKMYMVAMTCKEGLDFNAIDKEPVYLMILIVSPENTVGPHIRALSSVSRIMADANVRQKLVNSKTSSEFLESLAEAEELYT